MKNDTLFYGKRHVVLMKTTRRFDENNTSFYGKQHVVFRTTMGCLRMKDLGSVF